MHVSQTNLLTTVVQEPPAVLFSYIYFSCFSNHYGSSALESQNSSLCYARITVILQREKKKFAFKHLKIPAFQSSLELWKRYLAIPKAVWRCEFSVSNDSLLHKPIFIWLAFLKLSLQIANKNINRNKPRYLRIKYSSSTLGLWCFHWATNANDFLK